MNTRKPHIPGPQVGYTPTKRTSSSQLHQQSLNHLLNFSLPPRVQQVQSAPRRSKKAIHHQVWNKEKFLNAQYRFVMKPSGDYTVHFADPDIYLQWQDILEVIIPRPPLDSTAHETGLTTCPICLSPPTAPRMTKCGHVFCFPCILHYLETGANPKWHRCPICFDSVTSSQLKSVQWSYAPTSPAPNPDSMISLRLIQRPQITTLALPRSDTWPSPNPSTSDLLPPHEAPFHFLPDVQDFARFMLATPERFISDVAGDIAQLEQEEQLLASVHDELSLTFVVRAKEKCLGMLIKAQEMETDAAVRLAVSKKRRGLEDAKAKVQAKLKKDQLYTTLSPPLPDEGIPDAFLSTQSPSFPSLVSAPTLPLSTSRSPRNKRNVNPPPPSSSSYLYYQSASGANIFLHPLDIRILLSHYGSYASFPDTISVPVTHSSEGAVDDDLRRRCKYLAHLPEGADVVFVEVDLESVVGSEGLKPFESLLKVRATKRKERVKKEDKAKMKAEEKERDNLFGGVGISLGGGGGGGGGGQGDQALARALQQSWAEAHDDDPPVDRPLTPPLSSSPRSLPASTTPGAWGTRSFAATAHSSANRILAPSRDRETEIALDWEYDQAWHDLEEATVARGGGGGGGGGKKKGRKLVLLGGGAGARLR